MKSSACVVWCYDRATILLQHTIKSFWSPVKLPSPSLVFALALVSPSQPLGFLLSETLFLFSSSSFRQSVELFVAHQHLRWMASPSHPRANMENISRLCFSISQECKKYIFFLTHVEQSVKQQKAKSGFHAFYLLILPDLQRRIP